MGVLTAVGAEEEGEVGDEGMEEGMRVVRGVRADAEVVRSGVDSSAAKAAAASDMACDVGGALS